LGVGSSTTKENNREVPHVSAVLCDGWKGGLVAMFVRFQSKTEKWAAIISSVIFFPPLFIFAGPVVLAVLAGVAIPLIILKLTIFRGYDNS